MEYWANGAWIKAKSIEEEKRESDWTLKRTEGARKKTGWEQATVVGRPEWNLVQCVSLLVDLNFLDRGLVPHDSKSVSCALAFSACGNSWLVFLTISQVGPCRNFGRSYRAELMISAVRSVLSSSIQWKSGTGIERLWVNSPQHLLPNTYCSVRRQDWPTSQDFTKISQRPGHVWS